MSALDAALNWTKFITAGSYDELASLAAPGATWTILGDAAEVPFAGEKDYAGRVQRLKENPEFKLDINVLSSAANGDDAFVEFVSTASKGNFKMEVIARVSVKDGKIVNIKEYLDSAPIAKAMAAAKK